MQSYPTKGEGQRVRQPSLNVIEESSKNHLIGTERISKFDSHGDEADIKGQISTRSSMKRS